jgi:hypothetical protein
MERTNPTPVACFALGLLVAALAAGEERSSTVPASASKTEMAAFAGDWVLSVPVEGSDPRAFDLALKVENDTLTGTFVSDHAGSLAIQAVSSNAGVLSFAVPMMGMSEVVSFTAKRNEDGSLTGTIAGPMGAMTFTGKRAPAANRAGKTGAP